VLILRGGYVGVGNGLTGGHCDKRSSILRQSLGMWYPDGSLVVCPFGVGVTPLISVGGIWGMGGAGEIWSLVWTTLSVSVSSAMEKC
jgi:hypothetical protein